MAFGVLIVDDSRFFLEAARGLLERGGPARCRRCRYLGVKALRQAEELRPEVVLVDIMLGE